MEIRHGKAESGIGSKSAVGSNHFDSYFLDITIYLGVCKDSRRGIRVFHGTGLQHRGCRVGQ